MAGHRDCDSVVTSGRLAKGNEFFGAAERLEDDMPSAAGACTSTRRHRGRGRDLLRSPRHALQYRQPQRGSHSPEEASFPWRTLNA